MKTVNTKQQLADRIHDLMSKYKGSIRYYNTNRGYAMVAAKLEDEGYDTKDIDDAIDEYGNMNWLKR